MFKAFKKFFDNLKDKKSKSKESSEVSPAVYDKNTEVMRNLPIRHIR